MLKEACAISALAAAALVPSAAAQAQSADSATSLRNCASTSAGAPCKWMTENNKRCYYCKQSKKKGGGWKRLYCQHQEREY